MFEHTYYLSSRRNLNVAGLNCGTHYPLALGDMKSTWPKLRPRKKIIPLTGPDGCERSCCLCMYLSQLTMGESSLASEEDPPFTVRLARDQSGSIFVGEELGESSLMSQTLYPFASELVSPNVYRTLTRPHPCRAAHLSKQSVDLFLSLLV